MKAIHRLAVCAWLGFGLAAAPRNAAASPAPSSLPSAHAAICPIPPGTYIILNSDGDLVGALIVFPDCRIEILPVEKDQQLV